LSGLAIKKLINPFHQKRKEVFVMKSFIGKGYDRQRAAAYAVYMMAGSYFCGRNTMNYHV